MDELLEKLLPIIATKPINITVNINQIDDMEGNLEIDLDKLLCPICGGSGDECNNCGGTGYLECSEDKGNELAYQSMWEKLREIVSAYKHISDTDRNTVLRIMLDIENNRKK